MRKPEETILRDVPISPSLQKLIDAGKVPPHVQCYEYGLVGVLVIEPLNGNGWYVNMVREDRQIKHPEVQQIMKLLLPDGVLVDAIFSDKGNNKFYGVQVFERKISIEQVSTTRRNGTILPFSRPGYSLEIPDGVYHSEPLRPEHQGDLESNGTVPLDNRDGAGISGNQESDQADSENS